MAGLMRVALVLACLLQWGPWSPYGYPYPLPRCWTHTTIGPRGGVLVCTTCCDATGNCTTTCA